MYKIWGSRQEALMSQQCRQEPDSLTSLVLISSITQSTFLRGLNLRTRISSLLKQFGLFALEGGSRHTNVEFLTFSTSWVM